MEENNSNFEEETYICSTPEEIIEAANEATQNLLPEKSKEIYKKEYAMFMEWKRQKEVNSFSERVLLAYFQEKAKTFKSSTLWSSYSKLKSTLIANNQIDISKYPKLISFLKRQSVGYKAKKSKTFSRKELNNFLLEAPDDIYLMTKVAVIFGIAGACRREELYKMSINNIEDRGSVLVIKIPDTKTHIERTFTVIEDSGVTNLNLLNIYKKYVSLRPTNAKSTHLFLTYRNGKCINQRIGINQFSKIPFKVAKYLNLAEPNAYTGHSFRRTSASLLVDSGGDLLQLKKHGGWKSSAVAEGYVDGSFMNKIDCDSKILSGVNKPASAPTTSSTSTTSTNVQNELHLLDMANNRGHESISISQINSEKNSLSEPKINIMNSNNCTFNINIMK